MGWSEFALALTVFLLSHAIPVRAPVKPWLQAQLGERGFTVAYSLLSLAVLVWLIIAAGRAPFVPLWAWAPWQNVLVIAVMLVVCMIVALSLGRPNPFSFGGPDLGYDPDAPGLVRWLRHPLLWALALWAAAHGLANGSLAFSILFFGFAAFAVFGMAMIDRRRQGAMGDEWHALWAATRAGDGAWIDFRKDSPRLSAGVLLWGALIIGHEPIIGVSPWP